MWHWVVCSTLSTWRSLTSFMEIFYSSFPNVTVVACLGTAGEHLKLSLQRQRWLTCPECVSSVEIAAEQRGEERRGDDSTTVKTTIQSKSSHTMKLIQYGAKEVEHPYSCIASLWLYTIKSIPVMCCWTCLIPVSLHSGRLYRLVSGLPEVPGAAGRAGAAEVRSVLWVHPGQLQPGAERGPQPHVVPQLWPRPQRLRGAHLFRRRAHEQGGGRHLVQTGRPPGRGPVLLCVTVGSREKAERAQDDASESVERKKKYIFLFYICSLPQC